MALRGSLGYKRPCIKMKKAEEEEEEKEKEEVEEEEDEDKILQQNDQQYHF